MAKNMTRKGLALGAAFALVSSALVASPALAANEIVLAPSAGTLTGMISGEAFTVQATVGSTIVNTQYDKVKYAVSNPSGLTVTTTLTATGSTGDTDLSASTATSGVVKSNAGTVTAQATTLAVSVGAAEEGSVSVTAWIDSDGDDVIDATEYASAAQTITFTKVANVSASVTIDAVRVGDTAVSASVVLAGINMHQLTASEFGVNFTKGDGTALMAATTTVTSVTANADTKALETGSTATVAAIAADSAVKAQAVYKNGGSAASTDTIGAASTLAAVAVTAATIVGDAVASTTAKVTTAGSAADSLLNSSFQAKVVVKDGATTPAAVAGAAVTAKITSTGLSAVAGSEKTLTVNGTTYSSSTALPGQGTVAKLALTTDADGVATINFTTAGYAAGDTIAVVFYTENLTASTLTITQRAATYTATVRPFFTTVDSAAVSVPVVVYDQFGGVPADKYDVRATFNSGLTGYVAQATTAATTGSNAYAQLAGGKATLSILDNGVGLGVNTYAITVQERLAGNNYGSNVVGTVQTDVHIVDAATLVAATVTSNGTQNTTTKVYEIAGPVALSLVDTANYDSTSVLGAAPSSFTGALTAQNITGTVKTVASATLAAVVVPGAAVTLSGAGLEFGDGSGKYSANSITVYANTSGVYSANVYSNKAGKQTITITSGAATATTTVVFAQAKDDTGAAIAITAPANVLPGSTLAVSAVLTDKFGNTVTTDSTATEFNNGTTAPTFTLTSDAPGFQIGTDPSVTSNGGSAKLAYFLGVNDSGTITVTGTYDADGAGTAFAAVTVTATITIGSADVATWTKKLDDSSAKIYAKNIVGAGKVQFFLNGKEIAWVNATSAADSKLRTANGSSYLVRTVEFAAGKNVLEVYVDGVRTTRVAYTK